MCTNLFAALLTNLLTSLLTDLMENDTTNAHTQSRLLNWLIRKWASLSMGIRFSSTVVDSTTVEGGGGGGRLHNGVFKVYPKLEALAGYGYGFAPFSLIRLI